MVGIVGMMDNRPVERGHLEEGFRAGMRDIGLQVREDWVVNCELGPPSGGEAFDRLFSQAGQKPTAIICATDDIAFGVLGAARP